MPGGLSSPDAVVALHGLASISRTGDDFVNLVSGVTQATHSLNTSQLREYFECVNTEDAEAVTLVLLSGMRPNRGGVDTSGEETNSQGADRYVDPICIVLFAVAGILNVSAAPLITEEMLVKLIDGIDRMKLDDAAQTAILGALQSVSGIADAISGALGLSPISEMLMEVKDMPSLTEGDLFAPAALKHCSRRFNDNRWRRAVS